MRFIIILTLVALCLSKQGYSQSVSYPKRYLILLDYSYNMSKEWLSEKSHAEGAKEFILELMMQAYKIDSTAEFSLRVLGHQYPRSLHNCFDSKQEVHFSRNNYEQMSLRLNNLSAIGTSSVAHAMRDVPKCIDLKSKYQYAVLLLTATGESCSGNFCQELKQLNKNHSNLPVYVLQFNHLKSSELHCAENNFLISSDKHINEAIPKILGSGTQKNGSDVSNDTLIKLGFGFLRINNVFQAEILGLSYAIGEKYIPFTQFSLTNTTNKHKIRIKAGKYKVEYRDLRHHIKATVFSITADDTTQIDIK